MRVWEEWCHYRRHSCGDNIVAVKKQAEPIIEQEEELLWEKGLLGDATPQSLLDSCVHEWALLCPTEWQ